MDQQGQDCQGSRLWPASRPLKGISTRGIARYDLDYPDNKRVDRFIEELQRFEKEGSMPQMTILRLGNDHTYGTLKGKPTPTAMVAENDLALGRFVEAISKSKFWKETAIFVIEDDAQNGSDHVDAHRTVALCISPYTQHGKVDSTMYATSSMLRTMELILGLRPMSAVRRRRPADVQQLPEQAESWDLHACGSRSRHEGGQPGQCLGLEAVRDLRFHAWRTRSTIWSSTKSSGVRCVGRTRRCRRRCTRRLCFRICRRSESM